MKTGFLLRNETIEGIGVNRDRAGISGKLNLEELTSLAHSGF